MQSSTSCCGTLINSAVAVTGHIGPCHSTQFILVLTCNRLVRMQAACARRTITAICLPLQPSTACMTRNIAFLLGLLKPWKNNELSFLDALNFYTGEP